MFYVIISDEKIIKNYGLGHFIFFGFFPIFHPDRRGKDGAQMKRIVETMASLTPITTKEVVDLESNRRLRKNDVMLVWPSDPKSRSTQMTISNGDKNRL